MGQQRAPRHAMHRAGHVVINARHQVIQGRRCRSQRRPHLGLTLQAVRDQAAQHVVRPRDQKAVTRRQPVQVHLKQVGQRLQVGHHVAIGRVDDHGGPLHHMVAGEQQLLFLQQVAQVVGRVARGVDDAQRDTVGQHQLFTVLQFALRLEVRVLPLRKSRDAAQHRRAGGQGQGRRAGRVVTVCVCDENLHDAPWRRRLDRRQVRLAHRPRVDDGPRITRTDEIGVGARPGHGARVGRSHAHDVRRQAHGAAGQQVGVDVAAALGVQPRNLGIGQFIRQHHTQAACGRGAARHDQRQRAGGQGLLRGLQRGRCIVMPPQLKQRALRHRQQLEATFGRQGLGRRQPHQLHRLTQVSLRHLTRRSQGQEKARVEALG